MNSLQLDTLNPEQHAAVTSDSQNLLVLAGAGSGKNPCVDPPNRMVNCGWFSVSLQRVGRHPLPTKRRVK